jgi:hypothetical protein
MSPQTWPLTALSLAFFLHTGLFDPAALQQSAYSETATLRWGSSQLGGGPRTLPRQAIASKADKSAAIIPKCTRKLEVVL